MADERIDVIARVLHSTQRVEYPQRPLPIRAFRGQAKRITRALDTAQSSTKKCQACGRMLRDTVEPGSDEATQRAVPAMSARAAACEQAVTSNSSVPGGTVDDGNPPHGPQTANPRVPDTEVERT